MGTKKSTSGQKNEALRRHKNPPTSKPYSPRSMDPVTPSEVEAATRRSIVRRALEMAPTDNAPEDALKYLDLVLSEDTPEQAEADMQTVISWCVSQGKAPSVYLTQHTEKFDKQFNRLKASGDQRAMLEMFDLSVTNSTGSDE